MSKKTGFTLVEIVIVVVLVGILSIVGVPIYRQHVVKSLSVEGKALLTEIMAAQEIYLSRNGMWYGTATTTNMNFVEEIGVDARRNKYFTEFSWVGGSTVLASAGTNPSFTVKTEGKDRAKGVTLELMYYLDKPQEFEETYVKP